MDNNTVIVVVIALFAVIVLVAVLFFRKGGVKTKVQGPFGTGLEMDGSNPPPTPGAVIEDAKSRSGGIRADDQLGRGASVKRAEADKDIVATSRQPGEDAGPKA